MLDQSQFWWSKTTLAYFCAVDCEEALSQSPFRKGGQGGFEAGPGVRHP